MLSDPTDWLVGGGEMAKLIKAKDWSTTPLGPIASWPQSLRTTVSLVQASSSPISLAWGSGHTQIYNDGYWPICGAKHPRSMGQDFRECWASAFPVIGDAYASAWSGRSAYLEKMRMFLDRHGFLEETWFTFSFSPITDESGGVGGLFHPVTELTGQMLSERRTQTVRDLAMRGASARTVEEAMWLSASVFAELNLDVPFTIFYLVDEANRRAHRIARSGISEELAGADSVDLDSRLSPWAVADTFRSGERLELDVSERIIEAIGPYTEVPRHAVVLPIRLAGHATQAAVLVAGVSARLPLTDAYRMFYDLVASAVGTALINAHALDAERRKADALAELDRAKTAFFSNVSHEFRTPLTLILGPLEDALARPATEVPPVVREPLETVHRNSLRLLRLVNALLDFSRIEAGRMRACYEPTDLGIETAQLASVFRSAIERAGLALDVRCPSLPEPIYVDRDMWEKIVLNLLSNALKHTASGKITVEQRVANDRATLQVSDTGIGIAPEELPRVFERFHRVQGAWSRSHEGTGIGLALVRELVRAHGGDVEITSTQGIGTTATVTIPTGKAHLPAEQMRDATERAPGRTSAAFVEEALQWTPAAPLKPSAPRATVHPAHAPRIVLVDDNADMRAYVLSLLAEEFEVFPAADGAQALRTIYEGLPELPDLVLSDVMMPQLDGFGLLAALRADPRTQTVPVILLSARAGAEASTEGMNAGADDYLIKPFAARELIARVRTHVALGRTRRAWTTELGLANAELAHANAELARANAELGRANAELARANAELARTNAELETYSYSVSHDLRAPLRAIRGFIQILIDDADVLDAAGRSEMLQTVQRNARRMNSLIDDLLALAQVSRAELRCELVDVTQIAQRVVADLQLRDPSRRLDVQIGEGMTAIADGRLVAIALENVIGNAWKFTSKRDRAEITIGWEARGVLAVRDNGAGFDMAHASRLFEPFHRLHRVEEFDGTGIGLAIVRRIAERHGGQVWAEGEVDRGATIRITFEPISVTSANEATIRGQSRQTPAQLHAT